MLPLQEKWFELSFLPKKRFDFDITMMCVFISTVTTGDLHKMLYKKYNSARYPDHNIFQFPTVSNNTVDGRILTVRATLAKHFLYLK